MADAWTLKGELMLSCNCAVFCPCVVSLGQHPPTEGFCMGWMGVRIDSGKYGKVKIGGLNAGVLVDIPGRMGRGNWTVALYIDERADDAQAEALEMILTGQAGGTTGLLTVLVGEYLGAQRVPITYETDGKTRRFKIPRKIDGALTPIASNPEGADVIIKNSQYWMGKDIVVAKSDKSKVRDFGRVWDFPDRSAELVKLNWSGPAS